MHSRRYLLLPILVLGLLTTGCGQTTTPERVEPTPTATPTVTATPAPTPTAIPVPADKAVITGLVTWGEKPAVNATVVAEAKNPGVTVLGRTKRYMGVTGEDGRFVITVDPDRYYVGAALDGSDHITYETYGFGLLSAQGLGLGAGEQKTVDLSVLDWSMAPVSPGVNSSDWYSNKGDNRLAPNPITFSWKEYDWGRYDGKVGSYVLEVGVIDNGYRVLFRQTVKAATSFTPSTLIEVNGKEYRWQVRALSSTGQEIAGSTGELFFTPR